jgi:hypothetical protein
LAEGGCGFLVAVVVHKSGHKLKDVSVQDDLQGCGAVVMEVVRVLVVAIVLGPRLLSVVLVMAADRPDLFLRCYSGQQDETQELFHRDFGKEGVIQRQLQKFY